MEAIILAGGEGRRLRPLTESTPKPLLNVGGKPIMEWQIEWMKRFGVDRFVISLGYMKDRIIEALGDGGNLGVRIEYAEEAEPLGTGGAIKNACRHIESDSFFVMNGDILTNIDPSALLALGKRYCTVMSLVPLKSTFGVVDTKGDSVVGFREKPEIDGHWLNAGLYLFSKEAMAFVPDNGSVEKTSFPDMAGQGKLGCVKFPGRYWRSVDSFKDYEEAGKRKAYGGGRKPSKSGRYFTNAKSLQSIAEERASRKYSNFEVLNSYFVGAAGATKYYEVLLLDRNSEPLKSDRHYAGVVKKPGRAFRGNTSSGRKHRGIERKRFGSHKLR